MRKKKILAVIMSIAVMAGNLSVVQATEADSSGSAAAQIAEANLADSVVVQEAVVENAAEVDSLLADGESSPAENYDVWWNFEESIWTNTAIGGDIIAEGGTSGATLTQAAEEDGNHYLNIYGEKSGGYRVSRLNVNGSECALTTVVFDWMPKTIQDTNSRFGDVSFYSDENTYAYFGLQFDKNKEIKYYTIGENVESGYGLSYSEEALEGGLQRNSAVDSGTAATTGITADGATWYSVTVSFNHLNHTASLAIAQKDTPDTILYKKSDIPIYESATNLAYVGVGGWKSQMEMGIDNFGISFDTEIPPEYYYNTYWNDFEEAIWESNAIGSDVIAEGGTSGATLTQETTEDGNHYMKLVGEKSGGYRVSKLAVSDEAAEKAEVTFDWMPISSQDVDSRFGDISFYTTGNTYAYFGLQFDKTMGIKYYTIGENVESGYGLSYSEEALEGGFQRNSAATSGTAAETGITADGSTWYTVNLSFDYNNQTADISIVDKAATDVALYEKAGIPIYASAVNISSIGAGSWKAVTEMGIDNLGVKYYFSDAGTIVSVEQPENAMVLPSDWEQHVTQRPTKVVATMGDSSTLELEVGEWTSEPAFDPAVYGTYEWTAPLVLPEGIRNPKNLALSYTVEYVKNYKVMGAYDPTTLELAFGSVDSVEAFEAMRPTETQVVLSNGETAYAKLDASSWKAINNPVPDGSVDATKIPEVAPEFDPAAEGIYVYEVKLAEDGEYPLDSEITVQWRVNYYSTGDNFYGYGRAVENIDRGLYAVKNTVFDSATNTYVDSTQGGVYLSWRILVDEYELVSQGKDIVFEVYRNDEKVASLTNTTNYLDEAGKVGDTYMVKAIQNGVYSFSKDVEALADNYISIKLQRPLPSYGAADNLAIYRLNDTEVADVDGDNEYELIVKWYPNNGFDAGKAGSPSSPHIIDVYEMDGTALWRLFMGYSSPSGQHSDSFIAYDLDQDGKAELSILTQDGTRTYRPDENGQFAYVTTEEGGYVFKADDSTHSESTGSFVLSEDGKGYVLSSTDLLYVGDLGSPYMDDTYLVAEVGDRGKEGVGILENGHKSRAGDIAEYFTVFNGATGEIIDTVDYYYNTKTLYELRSFREYGDDQLSTLDRFNIGIATIPTDISDPECDTTIPAVICNRAYYDDMSHVAYTLVDGKIQEAWKTYIDNANEGGGNHNFATGDIDNDGFDEIYMGGTTIDHDGTVLWAKDGYENRDFMKHGDSIHLAAVFPDSEQLYVFTPVEDSSVSTIINYALTNGANGGRIVGHGFGKADTGRGMLANVTPSAGYELWSSNGGSTSDGLYDKALYNAYGEVVSESRPAVQTWASYWDGDLLSELPDSNPTNGGDKSGLPMGVHKYNWETGETETIASFEGTWTNNSSKNNPCLIADIMGDWREEILVRSTDNEELRIYMTNISTDYMIYSLMQDPVYRNSVANQNNTYNQPTHTSFYLGEDEQGKNAVLNYELPTYNYYYTTAVPRYTDITFESNGGTEVAAMMQVELGKTISAPEVTKEGYTLVGWYVDEACTEEFHFAEDTVEGAMTLYAKWEEEAEIEVELGDVEKDSWQYEPAMYVYQRGVMNGKGLDANGNVIFAPEDVLTRQELAQILYNAEGTPEIAYSDTFSDVADGQWYTSAVLWAAEQGIVSGYPGGSFGVDDPITREQAAVMLYKYAKYRGYDISARAEFDQFSDADSIHDWAVEELSWAVANGVINGKIGILDPLGDATRAESAAMLKNFMTKFE